MLFVLLYILPVFILLFESLLHEFIFRSFVYDVRLSLLIIDYLLTHLLEA